MFAFRAALLVACAAGLAATPTRAFETSPERLKSAWKARAEQATARLARGGLDDCDRALERAFQNPAVEGNREDRTYLLTIAIDDEALLVSFTYDHERLSSFMVGGLHGQGMWVLRQEADSKVMTFLHREKKCALDLCTSDPLAGDLCPPGREVRVLPPLPHGPG